MAETRYLRELAYELRWRRVPESVVVKTVLEAHSLADDSGPLEEAIGPPAEFARTVPAGKARPLGWTLTSILVGLAVMVLGFLVVWTLVLGQPIDLWVMISICAGAVVWCVAAALLGGQLDHRLPDQLTGGIGD